MEPEAADEILALREQLRQVQGKVEHLRRVGWEQSRSLAVTVPHLNSAVELSLKVSGAQGLGFQHCSDHFNNQSHNHEAKIEALYIWDYSCAWTLV